MRKYRILFEYKTSEKSTAESEFDVSAVSTDNAREIFDNIRHSGIGVTMLKNCVNIKSVWPVYD